MLPRLTYRKGYRTALGLKRARQGGIALASMNNYTFNKKNLYITLVLVVTFLLVLYYRNRDVDECVTNPCRRGGTCIDRGNGFTCRCPIGYEGRRCELRTRMRSCNSSPCANGAQCVEHQLGFKCHCPPGYDGVTCKEDVREAFSAYYPSQGGNTSVWREEQFAKTWTKFGIGYKRSTFKSPTRAVYLVSISAEKYPDADLQYSLMGSPYTVGLSSTHPKTKSIGRNFLMSLDPDNTLYMSYKGHLDCCVGTVSWSMFSISSLMRTLVAFHVAKTEPPKSLGRINFDDLHLNIADGYDITQKEFTAPMAGVYYFTVSAGLAPGQGAVLGLKRNGKGVIELVREAEKGSGSDLISSACLVFLNRGDKVHVDLISGSVTSSPENKDLSLSGFLYQPAHGHKLAWSVWRTQSYTDTAVLEPVPYDVVMVNNGGLYNSSENMVTAEISGIYYVNIVVGSHVGKDLIMSVFHKHPQTSVSGGAYIVSTQNEVSTLSHGVLFSLEAGQKIWVRAYAYSHAAGFYSNQNLVTGFSGFLVYPT